MYANAGSIISQKEQYAGMRLKITITILWSVVSLRLPSSVEAARIQQERLDLTIVLPHLLQ